MTRSTSINAYHEIKENGLLSKRRMEVYEAVYKYGPMTSAECFKKISDHDRSGIISQSRARMTELREMGVVCELGEKICSVTGRTAILWQATNNLPKDLEPKKTKKEKVNEVLEILRHIYPLASDSRIKSGIVEAVEKIKLI